MDITSNRQNYPAVLLNAESLSRVTFPSKAAYNSTVKPLAESLSKTNMRKHLETFTAFHTRYYKSSTGVASAKWLFGQVKSTITSSGADKFGATVRMFDHEWGQPSIIATIPGQSNRTIVIGAHQDSINLFFPARFAAPGADDDGSGTVTILEAMRVLLTSPDIVHGKAANTIEFHWYSAEEGGLLGSQAVFAEYSRQGRDIKAMFQQDMTGYVAKTLEAGQPESVGVITDFVDPALTEFIKELITTVSKPPSPTLPLPIHFCLCSFPLPSTLQLTN
jgi:bacterial leucyl aminopeptidase